MELIVAKALSRKSTIMKKLIAIAFGLMASATFAQNTYGDIIGTFTEKGGKTPIEGATVVTEKGEAKFRALTGEDGRFRMSAVPPGKYIVYVVYLGDTSYANTEIELVPDGIADAGIIQEKANVLGDVIIKVPFLTLSKGVNPETKLGKKDIQHMPTKFDAAAMISTMTSEVRKTENGGLVFRGAREGDFITYLDGVKMTQLQNVPSASLGYVMVYSGYVPAKYGDTTGGIVVMETLSYFDLLREWEQEQKAKE